MRHNTAGIPAAIAKAFAWRASFGQGSFVRDAKAPAGEPGKVLLEIIEVQIGSYLGEDDIYHGAPEVTK